MSRQLFGGKSQTLDGGDVAILSRFEITPRYSDRSSHFVIGILNLPDGTSLTCVALRLKPPVARIDFWTAGFWLDHQTLRKTHRQQIAEMMNRLGDGKASRPVIVGGDFNTTPNDPCLEAMAPQLRDTFGEAGRGWGATGTNDNPLFRVDQIWATQTVEPIQVMALKTRFSDHRMVVCDVTLQR